jgi:uncharacterized membrane protein (UPF0182 family)
VRVPENVVVARTPLLRRYQLWILIGIIVLVLLVFFVQAIADAYTNYLWYRSINETMIWRSMVETRLGLGIVFAGTFFLASWWSLWAVDRVSRVDIYSAPEHELARRYQASIGHYPVTVRTVVALLLALAVGVSASSQWQHWLLFLNATHFGLKDPQFQRDVGFFVFRLPFLAFLVDWSLIALLVLFIVTGLAHYLNGGLRTAGPSPRVDGHVVAHLSLILALMGLVRAAGYFFVDRYALDLSSSSVVAGAGYTDVHVRLPAMSVLAIVSMIAFVLLSMNVYHRTLVLPVVAVGLWAFLALMLGVIFPAFVQWLQVTPSQNTLELPYIERNIAYTRYAYGLDSIKPQNFGAHTDLQASTLDANHSSLGNLPMWDPNVTGSTYAGLQALRGYYQLSGLSSDRYELGTGADRALTPVVIGVRQINDAGEQDASWTAQHLEYTHGYGAVLSPSNVSTTSGLPDFVMQGTPEQSDAGAPALTQPEVYYGDASSTYVVANTREPELDYVGNGTSTPQTSHYSGTGGVPLAGFWQRAAYAMKFHDVNLLTSKLLTSKSRIIYRQNVDQLVKLAAPFLKVDAHPYPVIAGGQIYWMVDCYTTSDSFPYSEGAFTGLLSGNSGLQGSYNYVRDSVKAVVNAYTGQVRFYVVDAGDPVLIAWEHAYPGLFRPLKDMTQLTPGSSDTLLDHLKYPQDLLTLLTAMYGHYHYTPTAEGAAQFAAASDVWDVASTANGSLYVPAYELLTLPGAVSPSFVAVEPFVPYSDNGGDQLLAGFLTANSDYPQYGTIKAYEVPKVSASALGPGPVSSKITEDPDVAKLVALLQEGHSQVLAGSTLLVPIDDSLIYVEPIYVRDGKNSLPALEYVATDFGGENVGLSTTLLGSLRELFGNSVSGIGPPSSQTVSAQVEEDLALAYAAYERSVYDEEHANLGALQKDLNEMGRYLQQAHQLSEEAGQAAGSSPGTGGSAAPRSGAGHDSSAGSGSTSGGSGSKASSSGLASSRSSSSAAGTTNAPNNAATTTTTLEMG